MRILFDQGTPAPLRFLLSTHDIATAFERNWSNLRNGDLLDKAQESGFEIFITTDKNLKYQQNLAHRKIAIIVLPTTSWPKLKNRISIIEEAISEISIGGFQEIIFED